jgi:adenylate kinase family enzyme
VRVCITGGPRTGKTTRALRVLERLVEPTRVLHTDDLIERLAREPDGWSKASAEVATWFDAPGPWVIEGVAVPRALRKWLAAHRDGKPCDSVLLLERAWFPLSPGQTSMTKGLLTVWDQIIGELAARGVTISKERWSP